MATAKKTTEITFGVSERTEMPKASRNSEATGPFYDAAKEALADGAIHFVTGLPTGQLGKDADGKLTANQKAVNSFAGKLRAAVVNLDPEHTIVWRGPEDGQYFYQVTDIKRRDRNGAS